MNQEVITMDKDDIENKFKDRLRDQNEEHNGGSFWIGSMGKTAFGKDIAVGAPKQGGNP